MEKQGTSNSSLPLGIRRRRPSRRLIVVVLKELLLVPTGYNPRSLTSLSLSKFQNLEICLSNVQTLTSLQYLSIFNYSKAMAIYATAACPQQLRDAMIYLPCPKVCNPSQLPLSSFIPFFPLFFFLYSLILIALISII